MHKHIYTPKHTHIRKYELAERSDLRERDRPFFYFFRIRSFLALVLRTIYTLSNCLQVSSIVLLVDSPVREEKKKDDEKEEKDEWRFCG